MKNNNQIAMDKFFSESEHSDAQSCTDTYDCSEVSEVSSAQEESGEEWGDLCALAPAAGSEGEVLRSAPRLSDMLWKSKDPGFRPFTVVRRIYLGVEGDYSLPAISSRRSHTSKLPPFPHST